VSRRPSFDDRILRLQRRRPRSSSCRRARDGRSTFAYMLHTDLGHRCRGAKVDGQMVPLKHAAAERADGGGHRGEGGRAVARLGLNPELGYLQGQRAPGQGGVPGSNAQVAGADQLPRVRELVEKLLQREGKTAGQAGRSGRSNWVSAPPMPLFESGPGRTSSRCATSRCCCARVEPPPDRRRSHRLQSARRATARRRKGGGAGWSAWSR